MKLYCLLSLLLSLTNIVLSMDEAEYPITIEHKQTNRDSITLHLKLSPAMQNLRFLTLSLEEQELLNLEIPQKTNQNVVCILNSQQTCIHLSFVSPKPIDCCRSRIKHPSGSRFARITIPRIKE